MENNKREVLNLKLKLDFEKIYLIIIFFFILWAGVANLWDYKINHDFPFSYMASDTFQHQVRIDSIKQMGNYRYEAPYIAGGFKDAIGFYPPLMYHLDVIMSYASGLENYDIAYLLTFIILCFSSLAFYLIIRRWNKHIAMIALPLSFLLFTRGPGIGPYALITWGSWPLIFGQFFLICFFWYMTNFDLKYSWIFLAVFLSAIALQHQTELLFAAGFMIIMGIWWLAKKEFSKEKIKHFTSGILLFLVISAYYLIIFRFTLVKTQVPSGFNIVATTSTDQTLYLSNFGLILPLLIIGMIIALFMLKKKFSTPILISFFMLLVGFGNYIGLERHAFKTRCLWPIYLSLFLGISIYYLLKLVIKKWKTAYSFAIGIILAIILSGVVAIPYIPHSERFTSAGIMNQYHWQTFNWIKGNTDEDSKVLFLYGDVYNQNAMLRNTFRVPYMVNTEEYVSALANRTINRHIGIYLLGDHHGVHYAYRKSLLDYGYHADEIGKDYFYNTQRDICDFDFIIVDKVSSQAALAQYNILIANELIKNDFIKPVFDNGIVVILENSNRGEDCIAEQTTF